MDSEHRHELKESDLINAFKALKQWWAKYQIPVLIGAIVLAVLIIGIRWYGASARAEHEKLRYDLVSETSPAGFKLLAETTDNPTVRAQAYLRGADLYLQRSRTPAATGEKPMTPEERRNGLDAARAMYRIVLDTAEHEMFKLNARFGLGAVAEDIGEWADARQQYETIIEQAGDAHPALREQAKGKLALLPRLPSPVRLASGNGESSTDGEEEEDIPMPFGLRDIGVDELLRPPPPPPGGEATDGKATDPKPAKSGTPGDTPATTNTPTKPESPANPPDPAKP